MSAYRDSLPDDETRARYDEATANAGRFLAEAWRELAEAEAEAAAQSERPEGDQLAATAA